MLNENELLKQLEDNFVKLKKLYKKRSPFSYSNGKKIGDLWKSNYLIYRKLNKIKMKNISSSCLDKKKQIIERFKRGE